MQTMDFRRTNSRLGAAQRAFVWLAFRSTPFLLTLGVIAYNIYLLFTFKDRIVAGNVSPDYVKFANISLALILAQLYFFYASSKSDKQKVASAILYLVATVNVIAVITLSVVLGYFSTDG